MKILFTTLLFIGFIAAQTKTVITGNIQAVTGVPATGGYVEFDLMPQNQGVQFFVAGTGIIAGQSAQCGVDGSGNIKDITLTTTCQVWGNGLISPANTTYTIQYGPNNNLTNVVSNYCINGSTYDLTHPVFCPTLPLNPQSAVVITTPIQQNLIPGVDNIFNLGSATNRYATLYANNIFISNPFTLAGTLNVTTLNATTANITTINTPTIISPIITGVGTAVLNSATINGPVIDQSTNGIINAALSTGADIGAQINNSCSSSSGQTVWVPKSSVGNFSTAIIITNSCHVVFDCGQWTYTGTGTGVSATSEGSVIEGCAASQGSSTKGTVINFTGPGAVGFDLNAPRVLLRNIWFHGVGGTGNGGQVTSNQGSLEHIQISTFGGDCLQVNGTRANTNLLNLYDTWCSSNTGKGYNVFGVNANLIKFVGTSASANTGGNYWIASQDNVFTGAHSESSGTNIAYRFPSGGQGRGTVYCESNEATCLQFDAGSANSNIDIMTVGSLGVVDNGTNNNWYGGNGWRGSPTFFAGFRFFESAYPGAFASEGFIYEDSTSHRIEAAFNGAGTHSPLLTQNSTDNLSNKNLVQASNANTVTLLNKQDPGALLTGTGSAQTMYTYTLPANTLGAGKGIHIRIFWQHNTGSAAIAYILSFGGTSVSSFSITDTAVKAEALDFYLFNNSGVTNAQSGNIIVYESGGSSVVLGTGATSNVDTTSSAVVSFTFNVANTDQVTGKTFTVELIQ